MIELMFVVGFLAYVVQNAATGIIAAWRGDLPPRAQLRKAQIDHARKTGQPIPARYGVRDYAGDWISDALQRARDERRERYAQRDAKRAEQAGADDAGEPAAAAAKDRPKPSPTKAPAPADAPTLQTTAAEQRPTPTASEPAEAPKQAPTPSKAPADAPTLQSAPAEQRPAPSAAPSWRDLMDRAMDCRRTADWSGAVAAIDEVQARYPDEAARVRCRDASGAEFDVNILRRDSQRRADEAAAANPAVNGRPALRLVPTQPGEVAGVTVGGVGGGKSIPSVPAPAGTPESGQDTRPAPSSDAGTTPAEQGGTTVSMTTSGETTNIQAARVFLTEISEHLNDEVNNAIALASATLAGKSIDSETLSILARLQEQGNAMAALCVEGVDHLDSHHGLMETAVNSTDEVADTDFYQHS